MVFDLVHRLREPRAFARSLKAIFEGKFKNDPEEVLFERPINTGILKGYRLIQNILPQKLKENGVTLEKLAKNVISPG